MASVSRNMLISQDFFHSFNMCARQAQQAELGTYRLDTTHEVFKH